MLMRSLPKKRAFLPPLLFLISFLSRIVNRQCLSANKAINFKHFNLKVTRNAAKWRIVKRFAFLTLSKSYVFVHPNSMAITKMKFKLWANKLSEERFEIESILNPLNSPSSDCQHFIVSRHKKFWSVVNIFVTVNSHPRIFCTFGVQRKEKWFTSTEIRWIWK